MRKKKSKFLTFIFSFFPGVGHMYMGFMKIGLSIMTAFFFIIFLADSLSIGPLIYIEPVLICYSVFDCINKSDLSDEEYSKLEDKFLFNLDTAFIGKVKSFSKKNLIIGIILVFIGVTGLVNTIMAQLQPTIPQIIYYYISNIVNSMPKLIISAAIIYIGVKLILIKKKESDTCD